MYFCAMEKTICLYKTIDGREEMFPNDITQIKTSEFTYSAKRMGGAPNINCTVRHQDILDELWDSNVYVWFNGERYYLRNTPSTTFDNTVDNYKYELSFVSERINLESCLFFDVVTEGYDDYKPVTNGTEFDFFGDINEFVARLNSSMVYSKLPYRIEVGEGVSSERKMVHFSDKYISEAMQEIFNTYDLPYYYTYNAETRTPQFVVGYNSGTIVNSDNKEVVFEYGDTKSLLSISKNNANHFLINRITGHGSSDNIPSYYPNSTSKGEVILTQSDSLSGKIKIKDKERFANKLNLNEKVYFSKLASHSAELTKRSWFNGEIFIDSSESWDTEYQYYKYFSSYYERKHITKFGLTATALLYKYRFEGKITEGVGTNFRIKLLVPLVWGTDKYVGRVFDYKVGDDIVIIQPYKGQTRTITYERTEVGQLVYIDFVVLKDPDGDGTFSVDISFSKWVIEQGVGSTIYWEQIYDCTILAQEAVYGWKGASMASSNIDHFGLEYINGFDPMANPEDSVAQNLWFGIERDPDVPYITPCEYLMPSIYRDTDGEERFYNALNERYTIPNSNPTDTYTFAHPFIEGHPKEYIENFQDIKPTITGMVNADGDAINQFLAFAYDENDSDEKDENGNYIHPYFYAKLPKFSGDSEFNLFEHAIDEDDMIISVTDGVCGGCEWAIGVDKETKANPVQVCENENGEIVPLRNAEGDIVRVGSPQEEQNDTRNNEVWIALKKDNRTFGTVMPNQTHNLRPKAGDPFVILHIELPQSYITAAEKRLEEALIKYMHENNGEKFTFSIKFSRIYLAENPSVLKTLDENASVKLRFNNAEYILYVSSYTYKMTDKEILPEISVDLAEKITIYKNSTAKALSEIRIENANALNSIDFLRPTTPYFLRKDIADEAKGKITFRGGLNSDKDATFGDFAEGSRGAGVYQDAGGNWHIESDYLRVRKKMSVQQLEIEDAHHIGGQQILTAASSTIDYVREVDNCYRCYFLRYDTDGASIVNTWRVGDQAYCRTFNVESANKANERFYWYKVVAVDAEEESETIVFHDAIIDTINYHSIDLDKNICAPQSDIPLPADNVVQLGYQGDDAPERQNAIVLAGAGEGSPYIRQYIGINSFTLPEPDTQIKPDENILSGKTKFKTYDKETGEETGESTLGTIGQNLEVGVSNLLRNSGFTGDYETADLTGGTSLKDAFSTFSPSLEHWEHSLATAQESDFSQSGKHVCIDSYGGISQTILHNVRVGEDYIISFYGKGGQILVSFGGALITIEMTSEWKRYSKKVRPTTEGNIFTLRANDSATLCDIMLEKGNVLSEWTLSPLDNRSELAKYETLTYLQNILKADTEIDGGVISTGVVNTGLINMGHYDEEGKISKVTAGISGTYNNDDSVAFFGGGDLAKAIYTVQKYKENPNYEPTTEELASMAKAVITHGGRAILQDIILRGYVYAEGGVFRGTVYANDGEFRGNINANGVIKGHNAYGDIVIGMPTDNDWYKEHKTISATSPVNYSPTGTNDVANYYESLIIQQKSSGTQGYTEQTFISNPYYNDEQRESPYKEALVLNSRGIESSGTYTTTSDTTQEYITLITPNKLSMSLDGEWATNNVTYNKASVSIRPQQVHVYQSLVQIQTSNVFFQLDPSIGGALPNESSTLQKGQLYYDSNGFLKVKL